MGLVVGGGGGVGRTAFSLEPASTRAGVVSGDPPGHGLALVDTTYTMGSTSAFSDCDWPSHISSLSPPTRLIG